jgi:hypothetical protein
LATTWKVPPAGPPLNTTLSLAAAVIGVNMLAASSAEPATKIDLRLTFIKNLLIGILKNALCLEQ